MLNSASPLVIPQKLNGRYEISDAPIGQGGMGVVYKAYDTVTKRHVALKTMWGNVDPGALELFEREWTVLARLSHPNIVDILDTGDFREGGHRKPYFVMPLLPGVTLDQLIKSASERLTVERTVGIIHQACRGLQAAHDQGLVHRDLKPSNIFVMEDDTVKIIDFGVVHLADTRSVTGIKGTLQYMAPEQLEMKPATPLSDIFSLAVVCYESLTGRKPFGRKTEGEVVDAIRTYIPPPASEINAAVNQLLSRTVHKAMAKQPWHRFSSAREFADTLQKALRNEPIERFDRAKIQPRIDRIRKAHGEGDHQFAMEILTELESEGHIDPEMSLLRIQIEQSVRQKTIRQLLDSARTRMEEEEFPLALQKIQDVLNIDPDNVDASSLKSQIERQRSEKQIENWFRLVRQHLDNQLYSQARQGLQEILKINSSDSQARELLAEISRTEEEAAKIREEKQKLYDAALASYQHGEVSTALSKLERLFDLNRRGPVSSTPDRDAQYQGLYNQIRSERDAARNAYAEGRKHLVDHNFARALEICQEFLQKHPGDPMFQALQIEAEEAQRQEQSAAVAEVNRRMEAEPDLDKKYNIIKEAVEKYPAEQHFKSSLKLVKDRRDLINSIVGRARQYEERGQFNDASGQWDILRNIYPLYPGLDFEIQRLARRRDEQVNDEAKARWVEKIDRHFGAGEYNKASDVVKEALLEFPEDKELQGLESLAGQAIKRSAEAGSLLQEGQALLAEQKYEEGLNTLRRAERLDERNLSIRAALLAAILQRSRELVSRDWQHAEPLVKEALELDSSDPVARSLASLIEDYKRQEGVGKFVLEARDLQAAGDLSGALQKVGEGLRVYPNEIRLSQLHNTLRNAIGEARHAESPPLSPEQAIVSAAPPLKPDLSDLPPPVHTVFQPIPTAPARADVPPPDSAATRLSSGPPPVSQPAPAIKKPPPSPGEPQLAKLPSKNRTPLFLGAAALVLIIAIAIAFLVRRPRTPIQTSSTATIPATPRKLVNPTAPPPAPTPPELRISSDLKAGKLVLDDLSADLQQGNITKDDMPSDGDHSLKILDGNREVFSFAFHVKPNELPSLAAPPNGVSQGVVITALGGLAKVYASPRVKGGLEGQPVQPIPPEGLNLVLPAQGSLRFIVDDGKGKPHPVSIDSSASPYLSVQLSGAPERIPLTVTANVADAIVALNGKPIPRWRLTNGSRLISLPPGKYTIKLIHDDYQDSPEQTVEIKAGDTKLEPLNFSLTLIAHDAIASVESAPSGTEVLVDGSHAGLVGSSGTFTTKLPSGNHSITLRKSNFDDLTTSREFKAGETAKISGEGMKPYGSIAFKILPQNAKVTYLRQGDSVPIDSPNNQSLSLRPGTYEINAQADTFVPKSDRVTVISGKPVIVDWKLTPAPKAISSTITPDTVLVNSSSWSVRKDGWWIHDAKGLSLLKPGEGSFVIDILKDTQKGFFKTKVKKISFVADYKGDGDWISYTLDVHNLTRKVVSGGHPGEEKKVDHGMETGQTYRLMVDITPETVVIKNGKGAVLDSFKRNGAGGKFGFEDEVALIIRAGR